MNCHGQSAKYEHVYQMEIKIESTAIRSNSRRCYIIPFKVTLNIYNIELPCAVPLYMKFDFDYITYEQEKNDTSVFHDEISCFGVFGTVVEKNTIFRTIQPLVHSFNYWVICYRIYGCSQPTKMSEGTEWISFLSSFIYKEQLVKQKWQRSESDVKVYVIRS